MRSSITKATVPKKKSRCQSGPAVLLNAHLHPDAAGIDVGAKEFVAALPPGRAEVCVATFRTFTSGVHALRDWLLEHGIKTVAMTVLMSETGTREQLLKAFPTAARFCSWLGLCPDNRVSGGKVLKTKTRKVKARLARAFRLAVYGLERSDTEMGHYFRRMKGRLGKAEGITAAAHKLARIVYALIEKQCPYNEKEAFKPSPQNAARRLHHLQKQAQALGYELAPTTKAA